MAQPNSNQFVEAVAQQSGRGVSKIDPVSLPGFGPKQPEAFKPEDYKVRYSKIDLDDLGSIAELEILETRALHNDGIYILNKERFTFMDKMLIVVSYLEKDTHQ